MISRFSVGGLLVSTVISSQAIALDPAPTQIAGVTLTPQLRVSQAYTDNLYSQPENEVESWITLLNPSVSGEFGNNLIDLSVKLDNRTGYYEAESDDNFSDTTINVASDLKFNHRNQLGVGVNYALSHEDRGTGLTEGAQIGLVDEPITFSEQRLFAEYRLGSDTSKGRLELGVDYGEKEYDNFRELTERRDFDVVAGHAEFFYRIGARSDWTFEYESRSVDYVSDPAEVDGGFDTLDAQTQTWLTGITWTSSAKVESRLRVGYVTRTFDDADRQDFDGASWDVDVTWSPVRRSEIQLLAGREDRETNGQGNFIDAQVYGLRWGHGWAPRFRSTLSYEYADNDYVGGVSERSDKIQSFSVSGVYNMHRWMDVSLSWKARDKESTSEQYEYARNYIGLHIDLSL